ncbi:hypothetical protein [Clostridium perfringens]|uniref:hypothetical protein n=1 Tax=Clostridium perfringens TaxID=1502 RepID=UPI0024BD1A86|nr:hypothetical protein [Clostridium perfringens]
MIDKYRLLEAGNKHSLNKINPNFDLTIDYKSLTSLGVNSTRDMAYLSQILIIDLKLILSELNDKYSWIKDMEETEENLVLIDAKNILMKSVQSLKDFHIALKTEDFDSYIKVFDRLRKYDFPKGSIMGVETVNLVISEEYTRHKKQGDSYRKFKEVYGLQYVPATPMWNKMRFELLCELQLFKTSVMNYLLDLCRAFEKGLNLNTRQVKRYAEESKILKRNVMYLLVHGTHYTEPETWRITKRFGNRDSVWYPETSDEDYVRVLKYQIQMGQIKVSNLSDEAIKKFHNCDELQFLIDHDGYDRVDNYFRFCVIKRRDI